LALEGYLYNEAVCKTQIRDFMVTTVVRFVNSELDMPDNDKFLGGLNQAYEATYEDEVAFVRGDDLETVIAEAYRGRLRNRGHTGSDESPFGQYLPATIGLTRKYAKIVGLALADIDLCMFAACRKHMEKMEKEEAA